MEVLWKAVKKRKSRHDLCPNSLPYVDLALVVNQSMTYETLRTAAFNAEKKLLKDVSLFDVYQGKGLEEEKRATPWHSNFSTPRPR